MNDGASSDGADASRRQQPDTDRRAELAANLAALTERIVAACRAASRQPADLVLVAISKTWPVADVAALAQLGVADFGENKDAEAAAKAAELPEVRWHFVGQVQTNKARSVASYAHLVHSLDRQRLAAALSVGAVRKGRTVGVLVQASLDGDPRRGGAPIGELAALADHAAGLPGLRLAGVMAVVPAAGDPRRAFDTLVREAGRLRRTHPDATVISAGMSGDLEQAVAAGATHLRVGTALFGHRSAYLG